MDHFLKVAILESDIEAGLLDSVLNEREIPHILVSYHDTAFNGLYQTQKGWGHVSAPKDRAAEIKEILADLRKGVEEETEKQK